MILGRSYWTRIIRTINIRGTERTVLHRITMVLPGTTAMTTIMVSTLSTTSVRSRTLTVVVRATRVFARRRQLRDLLRRTMTTAPQAAPRLSASRLRRTRMAKELPLRKSIDGATRSGVGSGPTRPVTGILPQRETSPRHPKRSGGSHDRNLPQGRRRCVGIAAFIRFLLPTLPQPSRTMTTFRLPILLPDHLVLHEAGTVESRPAPSRLLREGRHSNRLRPAAPRRRPTLLNLAGRVTRQIRIRGLTRLAGRRMDRTLPTTSAMLVVTTSVTGTGRRLIWAEERQLTYALVKPPPHREVSASLSFVE